jgi:hypothetical protein
MTDTTKLFNVLADGLADGAINAAFAYMQAQMGVTDGGFAGQFLDCDREKVLKDMFVQYINEQLTFEVAE